MQGLETEHSGLYIYLNFLASTWLQLPGAAQRSTTLFTAATWQNILHRNAMYQCQNSTPTCKYAKRSKKILITWL